MVGHSLPWPPGAHPGAALPDQQTYLIFARLLWKLQCRNMILHSLLHLLLRQFKRGSPCRLVGMSTKSMGVVGNSNSEPNQAATAHATCMALHLLASPEHTFSSNLLMSVSSSKADNAIVSTWALPSLPNSHHQLSPLVDLTPNSGSSNTPISIATSDSISS